MLRGTFFTMTTTAFAIHIQEEGARAEEMLTST
jgi:hypothetical protein